MFDQRLEADAVSFAPGRADVGIGASSVRIRGDGSYRLAARIEDEAHPAPLEIELDVRAARRRYLPPVAIGGTGLVSGYVVPLLDARAEGTICVGSRCRAVRDAPAYHDHNWGVWRDVTWDWGQLNTGAGLSLLYGGVSRGGEPVGRRFAYLFDDLGFLRVLPIVSLEVEWSDSAGGPHPRSLALVAARGPDTLRLGADVTGVRATPAGPGSPGGPGAVFYQMRADATVGGRIAGEEIEGAGRGSFETWRRRDRSRPDRPADR